MEIKSNEAHIIYWTLRINVMWFKFIFLITNSKQNLNQSVVCFRFLKYDVFYFAQLKVRQKAGSSSEKYDNMQYRHAWWMMDGWRTDEQAEPRGYG